MKQDLFTDTSKPFQPLAARMRPQSLAEIKGQTHLLGDGKPLKQAIIQGQLHSMILWGSPGTGKTTLASLFSQETKSQFIKLSAVFSGVKEIREAVSQAKMYQAQYQRPTVLFIDEIHRFNKSQQDAFLPYVEEGLLILIGATTENPSFALNNALLSRARVYVLKPLDQEALIQIIQHTLIDEERGLGKLNLTLSLPLQEQLAAAADGDARRCLNLLEILSALASPNEVIDASLCAQVCSGTHRQFDKYGDAFYDQISALHKAVRGSDPDAALYWYARMIDGGCDLLYLARRVLRMAYEDIGLADPRGIQIASQAWESYERLGSPEGDLAIANAIVYLACAAKSNAVYTAFKAAQADVITYGSLPVPLHLRNAPTALMRDLEYGKHYRYAHDESEGFAAGEKYFPDEMNEKKYYQPVARGLEIAIKEKLDNLKNKNQKAREAK